MVDPSPNGQKERRVALKKQIVNGHHVAYCDAQGCRPLVAQVVVSTRLVSMVRLNMQKWRAWFSNRDQRCLMSFGLYSHIKFRVAERGQFLS
jgi:hypothetical protein